jgi:hypothetical protein
VQGLPCFWRIPSSKQDNQNSPKLIALKRFTDDCRKNCPKEESIQTCYYWYLELLKKLAEKNSVCWNKYDALDERIIQAYSRAFPRVPKERKKSMAVMAHLEKMLFMMKEAILAPYMPQNDAAAAADM